MTVKYKIYINRILVYDIEIYYYNLTKKTIIIEILYKYMNILMLNTSDLEGGAARAAYNLHKSLRDININSNMLVQLKQSDNLYVTGQKNKIEKTINLIRPHIDKLPLLLYPSHSETWNVSWLPGNVINKIKILKPDIVHIHWICKGFIPVTSLEHIKTPIVWTLHDSWPFTGGCHITYNCNKYKHICNACPELNSTFYYDLSRWVYNRKAKVYKKLLTKMTVVTPSRWMADCVKESSLMKDFPVEIIPSGVDTNIFKPLDKYTARTILNLDKNKKYLLFGALSATSDKNKGFHYLIPALKILSKKLQDIELLVFGASGTKEPVDYPFPVTYLGRLYDDISLSILYSASDAVVVPSMSESQSLVTLEALSCGRPVVAFNVGGIPDMVVHMVNGYLAKPYDINDLASGMEWILNDETPYTDLLNKARQKAVE